MVHFRGIEMAKTGNGKSTAKSTTDKLDTKPTASATPPRGTIDVQMPDSETLKKLAPHIAKVRSHVRESFGSIVMSMMLLPRYRNQTLGDLQHLVLEPLIRDRVALAYPGDKDQNELADLAGMAIWASVSEEVDQRIREQIKVGSFPLRLKPEDWNSGDINWLLDVIAPNTKATTAVIANFGKVVKGGNLRLHPLIAKLVDAETLQKLGAQKMTPPNLQEEK
jgi:cytolysin-activating lysine-acyltransferase